MRQLPRTSRAQHKQLNKRPLHDPRIDTLRLISKLGFSLLQNHKLAFVHSSIHSSSQPNQTRDHTQPPLHPRIYSKLTHPLKNLLPPDIPHPSIQLPHLPHNTRNLILILTLNLTTLSNRHIKHQFHPSQRIIPTAPEPALQRDRTRPTRRETQTVQAAVGGAEGEARGGVAGSGGLGDDAVVVVEGLVYGDLDREVGGRGVGVCLGVVGFGFVVAWDGGEVSNLCYCCAV